MKIMIMVILILMSSMCLAQLKHMLLVKVSFDKPMNMSVYEGTNYEVIGNSGDTLKVYATGKITDSNDAVILIMRKPYYSSWFYIITVSNIFDKKGNEINYEQNITYFNYIPWRK